MNKEESSIEDVEDSMSDGNSESDETISLSEYEKIKDEYLRLAADFDNFKKRSEKERDSIGNASIAYFVESLFPLIDNFEIALSQDNVNEEIKTLGNMLSTVINSLQIEEVGAHGEDFDPKKFAFSTCDTNLAEIVDTLWYNKEELEPLYDHSYTRGKGSCASVGYLNIKHHYPMSRIDKNTMWDDFDEEQ